MRSLILVAGLFAALCLAGCPSGAGDQGKTITSNADVPKVDYDAEIAKIQANEHMPASAKAIAIGKLKEAQQQSAAKSGGK
jgi:hypothetical protein